MSSDLLEKYDFLTVWHLTDIANLESIFTHGLLSRVAVTNQGLKFQEVGWEKIVKSRENWANHVLTFVSPNNNFVAGRLDRHLDQHPGAQGLCLLEIDLVQALNSTGAEVKISNGLISKFSFSPMVGPFSHFEKILNWHALLDKRLSSSEPNVQFARGAEVLFPKPVPVSCIRKIWCPDENLRLRVLNLRLSVECTLGQHLFSQTKSDFSGGVQNFKFNIKSELSRIFHSVYGEGYIIGILGGRAVVDFENAGLQLSRFRDIWYP